MNKSKNIQLLDCTLRDGGRIIDCSFNSSIIIGIGRQLKKAGIDIIEVGFLRDLLNYNENSTFFGKCSDADRFIDKIEQNQSETTKYVVFIDYGMYDVSKLVPIQNTMITGIRYGFTKENFSQERDKILYEAEFIKSLGYDLYLQDVNTNGYNPEELKEIIKFTNEIYPLSFGIVDTYGSMYLDDLEDVFNLVDSHLDTEIMIDFHSHNNMQMSFALAQRIIQMSSGRRQLIIDATLDGMGKCAGNLNTELIVDYLSRKMNYDYNIDAILDAIDQYLYEYQKNLDWGYSIPAFMAGVFRSHPNNIIYLLEKYRLNNRDIKYILSGIDENRRQRYDYDNIASVYREYCANRVDDTNSIKKLQGELADKSVLIVAPGSSISENKAIISDYIAKNKPIVVSVNFVPGDIQTDYLFCANTIHWEKVRWSVTRDKCILTSNVHEDINDTILVDYSNLIVEDSVLGDNSTIMLLNLLKEVKVAKIILAGFDGLKANHVNYVENARPNIYKGMDYQAINREVAMLYWQFVEKTEGKIELSFITPSLYAKGEKEW